MKFAEKLAQITEGVNKAKVAREAGLPANAINEYIAKGYIPRIDKALALARVLKVPLEWLADEQQTGPAPSASPPKETLSEVSDRNLMMEVARRYRRTVEVPLLEAIADAEKIDWKVVSAALKDWHNDSQPPDILLPAAQIALALNNALGAEHQFNVSTVAAMAHSKLPGAEHSVEEFADARENAQAFLRGEHRSTLRGLLTVAEYVMQEPYTAPGAWMLEKYFPFLRDASDKAAARGKQIGSDKESKPPKKSPKT